MEKKIMKKKISLIIENFPVSNKYEIGNFTNFQHFYMENFNFFFSGTCKLYSVFALIISHYKHAQDKLASVDVQVHSGIVRECKQVSN